MHALDNPLESNENPMDFEKCLEFLSQGGDLVLTIPGCVCSKVKDMGPFLA